MIVWRFMKAKPWLPWKFFLHKTYHEYAGSCVSTTPTDEEAKSCAYITSNVEMPGVVSPQLQLPTNYDKRLFSF